MSNVVIHAENISKQYRLGKIGTGTITHDLNRWWSNVRGKEDPYLKIGEANDRSKKGSSEYVWSLQDINFEIQQGDAVGIIGRNGAGKSTLLKLLSKVTRPTTGHFKVDGRIASLLEVGTGFHPEMSGRENIYLNGAILGMTKREISRKFDEIVDFSGVERYIDTPVKRYSSGMYVRLAFAVAAHLESEILIIDEVLAVGDAEFQKKCLGKMGDVTSKEGRTILFVSHNMPSIQNLCSKGILLENGRIKLDGPIDDVLNGYLAQNKVEDIILSEISERTGNGNFRFLNGYLESAGLEEGIIETFTDFKVKLDYEINKNTNIKDFRIDIGINDYMGNRVAWMSSFNVQHDLNLHANVIEFTVESLPLAPGDYTFNLLCMINQEVCDWLKNVMPFTIVERDYYKTGKLVPKNQGSLLLNYTVK